MRATKVEQTTHGRQSIRYWEELPALLDTSMQAGCRGCSAVCNVVRVRTGCDHVPRNCVLQLCFARQCIPPFVSERWSTANGQFYDVENQATLKQTEHFRCNYIEWDPSGRYACTAVSQPVTGSHWKAQMDNGYQLFSFQASSCAVTGLLICLGHGNENIQQE